MNSSPSELSHLVPDFDTSPGLYRHWRMELRGDLAWVYMKVDPEGSLFADVELKLNSYDLSVDAELADLVTRLRFEHPEVKAVVLTSELPRVFCAGANIQMLAQATHDHKVNFCKFTNETRNAIEESAKAGQRWVAALNGTAAGGGYELALACDEIILVDDRSSTVSLPEVPLLGVLPGTGGLTRLVDKRLVRHDLADAFCTRAEGLRAPQALAWGLIDSAAPPSSFEAHVAERAAFVASLSDRPGGPGVALEALEPKPTPSGWSYRHLRVHLDPSLGAATLTLEAPGAPQPSEPAGLLGAGDDGWLLRAARELDHAILRLRFEHPELGTWVWQTSGEPEAVLQAEEVLYSHPSHWLVREISMLWRRVLRRADASSRSLFALVGPGSCFAGVLAELVVGADRSFMLDGPPPGGEGVATLTLSASNVGPLTMSNGLSRLSTRFWGHPDQLAKVEGHLDVPLRAAEALELGLVTFAPDELDWDDEIRLALEERAAFSPDALTAMEANLRFAGPETPETKVFARLSAWQNWVFLRPNASGPNGALRRYGSGSRPDYDRKRV